MLQFNHEEFIWPGHSMCFKGVSQKLGMGKGPSWGGATLFPKSLNVKDMLMAPAGATGPMQLKNAIQGKGFVTDDKASADAKAADAATAASAIPVSTPTSASGIDVLNAQMDLVQQEAMKKSIKKTIFAGDTGGFKGGASYGSAASGMSGAKL